MLNWSHKKVSWEAAALRGEFGRRKMVMVVGRCQDGGERVELDGYACACWKVWTS